jgi:hypothetical protein
VDDGIFDAWKSISDARVRAKPARKTTRLTLGAVAGLCLLLALSARVLLARTLGSKRMHRR